MGADISAFENLQLQPSPEPICATEPRFCLPNSVQLRLREKYFSLSGDDFKISDASGVVYFQCKGKVFSFRDKKVLLDNQGVPVLNLQDKLISFSDKYRVYAGADSDRQICKFTYRITFVKAKMSTAFTDVVTGRPRNLVLKGDWRDKRCVIYLGEPKQGGVPIAKIYRPLTGRTWALGVEDYILEVAAGVDIALMVIMCVALDEHARDNN